MRTITSTEAKAKLNAVLAEVERTGRPVTITNHGHPIAVLHPASRRTRQFGQLPGLVVAEDFDAPLPAAELADWEGAGREGVGREGVGREGTGREEPGGDGANS